MCGRKNKNQVQMSRFVFTAIVLLSSLATNIAHALCDPGQKEIASRLVKEARASFDDIDSLILLKRSVKTCPGYVAWMEIGRLESALENDADAQYAFENARDFYQPRGDGSFSNVEVRRKALASGWLAEVYLDNGELALASVATQEARGGYDAINQVPPDRLLQLQANIDDAMINAEASVLARSFEVQHERATRGIGVRPVVNEVEESPEIVAETDSIESLYEGDTVAESVEELPEADTDAISVPEESIAQARPVTESRLNIPVLFEYNSADLSDVSRRTVGQLGAALNALNLGPADSVVIVGHTDAQGSAEYNYELSVRRAKTVLDSVSGLINGNVNFEAIGRGEEELRYSGVSEDDHRRNRRVEIVVRR